MSKFIFNLLKMMTIVALARIIVLLGFIGMERKINSGVLNPPSMVVVGHSHPEVSVNDSILSERLNMDVKNYSRSGQSMFWSIMGARKLRYQGANYFLIEISNNTFNTGWKTTDDQRGLREADKMHFLQPEDWLYLFTRDAGFSLKLLQKYPIPGKDVSGGYRKFYESFKNQTVKENDRSRYDNDFDASLIHDFILESPSLNFVVFRAPQHPNYYENVDNERERFFIKELEKFKKYDNCVVLDFGHTYSSNSLFSDVGHMNYRGSVIFSILLSDTLKNSTLKIDSNFYPFLNNPNSRQLN